MGEGRHRKEEGLGLEKIYEVKSIEGRKTWVEGRHGKKEDMEGGRHGKEADIGCEKISGGEKHGEEEFMGRRKRKKYRR